jgi:nucleoid-associated protein YgaU
MTSRFYLAVALIGLVGGAGWGVYELSKRTPVAPADTTRTRAPEGEAPAAVAMLGPGDSTEAAAVAKPPPGAAEAEVAATTADGGAGDRAAVAAMPEQADPASGRDEQEATASASPGEADTPESVPMSEPAPAAASPPGAAPDQETGADQTPPRPAGVTETIRRALSGLLGGAANEPARERSPEDQIAAVPPPAPQESSVGDLAEIAPGAAPSFDIVRISPDGAAVIAGRAAPGAEVELRSGEQVIDRVHANRRGEWVALPEEPLPGRDQELTIAARVGDGPTLESNEVLVVAVPQPPPQPTPPVVAAASAPLAVALPKEGGGQGRILQAPGRISAEGNLALMMLDYDDTGRIRLRGEGSPGVPLRVYVDNQPAGAVTVEPDGQWSAVLEPTLAPGDYTLRIDQLDQAGRPTARLETPFTRVSQPPVEGDVQVDFVIVQPGNSLWRIARRLFGEGMHYVHIYNANHAQIRDPDLIYPGQVFEIPSGIGTAG